MSVAVPFDSLLDYLEHERAKWRDWIAADPVSRLHIPFQPGGRFPTASSLLDHTFLVQRRHLARLERATPPESTGVTEDDWQTLFDYAALVLDDLRAYLAAIDESEATSSVVIGGMKAVTGSYTMTRRRLALHIVLHEVRHFAQLAYAARLAGHEPPGEHDIFFAPER